MGLSLSLVLSWQSTIRLWLAVVKTTKKFHVVFSIVRQIVNSSESSGPVICESFLAAAVAMAVGGCWRVNRARADDCQSESLRLSAASESVDRALAAADSDSETQSGPARALARPA